MPQFTSENQPANKGRKPGVPNKQTREIKEVINYLVSALKDGDLDDMLEKLKEEKPEAVLSFLAKIAPKETTVKIDNQKLDEFEKLLDVKPEAEPSPKE